MLGLLCTAIFLAPAGIEMIYPTAALIMITACVTSFLLLREPKISEGMSDNAQILLEKNPKKFLTEIRQFLQKHKNFIWIILLFALLNESSRILWPIQLLRLGFDVPNLALIYAGLKIFAFLGAYVAGSTKSTVTKGSFFLLSIAMNVTFITMGFPHYTGPRNSDSVLRSQTYE